MLRHIIRLSVQNRLLVVLAVAAAIAAGVWALRGLPLEVLEINDNPNIRDLGPLEGMSLRRLIMGHCPRIEELEPLRGMPLTDLDMRGTKVQDLEPLQGMPLTWLFFSDTPVAEDPYDYGNLVRDEKTGGWLSRTYEGAR